MTILEETLAAAVKDGATVSVESRPLQRLTDGVTVRRLPTHADARGSVMELYSRVGASIRTRLSSPTPSPSALGS